MIPPVILITGIMASGKSTVAQALAEQLPRSVHLRGDVFRRFIVNGQAEMTGESLSDEAINQLRLRQELSAEAAGRYVEAGFTVVMQDIYLGDDLLAMVNRLAPKPVHVVVLCPSAESVSRRDSARKDERGKIAYQPGGLTPMSMDRILREGTPRIGLWLDTSELTAEQTVTEIMARLGEAKVVL